MSEHKNGISIDDMVFAMYTILVTGTDEKPALPEQVRSNTTNIKYLKSNRLYKICLFIMALGQGFLAWKIIFK